MPKEKDKKYRTQNYRKEWEKETWAKGWLSRSKHQESKAYCSLCDKVLVPGKSELIGHTKTTLHIKRSKTAQDNHSMTSFTNVRDPDTVKAELNVVALIARKNISFNFLDSLLETLHGIADDSKAIKNMTCNRTKGTYLLTECLAPHAHDLLVTDLQKSRGFSVLCDKATDITMNKVFCVNVRFLDESRVEPVTRFYRLIPVEEGDASGLFDSLNTALAEDELSWEKVTGYASDGENLMQGGNNSVLTRVREAAPGLFVLKCYCHTFHLVAEHACATLSKTANQLIHDVYNYFKLSPNRQKSFEEFQHFVDVEPHKILKPCQTRWLSVLQCVQRILEQWPALDLYFTSEYSETKSPQAERIMNAFKSSYIKATLEFSSYVLGDLNSLNVMFQSNRFYLHRLLQEIERVVRMFYTSFCKPTRNQKLNEINVDDQTQWLPLLKVYPGIMAYETMKSFLPHEKESFLKRCRDWYKEALRQILKRVDVADPILLALKDVNHKAILNGNAEKMSAGVLARGLPRLLGNSRLALQSQAIQDIDRQWRSLQVDETVKNGGWEEKSIIEFWQAMLEIPEYKDLARFMLEITALPQSTAEVERTFSKVNNNKTRLRNALAVRTLEAILKSSEAYPTNFEVNEKLADLHSKARKNYMERFTEQDRSNVESLETFD